MNRFNFGFQVKIFIFGTARKPCFAQAREWLIREATSPLDESILGLLYVGITAAGDVRSGGVLIEDEYLQPILLALDELRERLADHK